jgi:hypothetical protein
MPPLERKEETMYKLSRRAIALRSLGVVAVCAASLVVVFPSAAAAPQDVTCGDTEADSVFTGTARNLTVPAGGLCTVANATITNDLIMQAPRAHLNIAATTIGHDLQAVQPGSIQTSSVETPDGRTVLGTVAVEHDFVIDGTPGPIFAHDLCDLDVGHDMVVTGTAESFGMTIGDTGSSEGCSTDAGSSGRSNTIGHDLVVTNNAALSNDFFGPSGIDVSNNRVGHDLIFTGNTAEPGGVLEVSDNVVGHDATCTANNPSPAADDPADGPNVAKHSNSCG